MLCFCNGIWYRRWAERSGKNNMAYRCLNCMATVEGKNCSNCGYPAVGKNEEHQLSVGTVLRDRYQIGKVLGQGGFGITYLAWDLLMRRPVAVKEFFPNGIVYRIGSTSCRVECVNSAVIPHYQYSKERFLREARALVDFRDLLEVVEIYDFIEENNTAYIVMEYIKGVDLAKYIERRGGALSVEETFKILKPIMEALAKVHRHGIVHRDISPDNIMLDPRGGAKLLDFGAVRIVEAPGVDKALSTSTEAILKRGFAPLEQYNTRGSLGPWTDEYAMCATVWYCLTGTVPADPTVRMTEGTDPDWSTIPGLPLHQQMALRKGISCRAKDRYMTMDQLLADLFPTVYASEEDSPVYKKMEVLPDSETGISKHQQNTDDPVPEPGHYALNENGRIPAHVEYDTPDRTLNRKQSPRGRSKIAVWALVAVLIITLAVFAIIVGASMWSGGRKQASDTDHSHQWEPASCTEPKRCSECGKTKGSPLGHDWTAATCTEAQICAVCGETGDPALGHQFVPATAESPERCSNCGKYEGRSLGKPLVNFLILDHSEKDGLEDDDIQMGAFTGFSGDLYEDALLFWVSTQLEFPYEYIVFSIPDPQHEGLGVQIEYEIALTQENCWWDQFGTYTYDDFSASVEVYLDGVRIGGTGKITGTETGSGVLDIPTGGQLRIYCSTNDKPWIDCIFKATVYYTALPDQTNG